jgi:gluconokinase
MHAGIPLTDDDRWPWLRALRVVIEQALADGTGAVVTCSALKQAYRDVLSGGLSDVHYVHMTGDPNVLAARLADRHGHFMNPALLESQIATLEPPRDAVNIDLSLTPDAQVAAIRQALSL